MAVPAMIIEGDVIAAHSYWTDDRSRIVTESTVHTPDGQDVVVSQIGGSVDGIGMIQFPGSVILEPGMQVAVAAHADIDLAQQSHVVLDSVKVIAYPPAFVRTGPTKAGHYLYWETRNVPVTVDAAGTTSLPDDQEFSIIDASIDTWNTATAMCTKFRVSDAGRQAIEVGNDKVNLIKIRDTMWGRPASGNDPARTYSPAAAGITTAVYVDDSGSSRDGAIVDADVEINGVNFDVSASGVTMGPPALCHAELQNTLTHELGHLHGLEHTCRLSPNDPQWIDDQGNPVPSCSAVLPGDTKIRDATMYPTQQCGETQKSSLSDDDIQAICRIYPTAKDPGTCEPVGVTAGGCCSASRGADRPAGALLLAGVVALWVRRRPSRKSRGA
jgi:hypothetical protein